MKTTLLLSFLISTNLFAADNYRLFCQGNRGKVTVSFEKIENKLRFTYRNIEGKKDFPFYEGVVTEQTMPYIKYAQKELNVIDDKLVYEWNIEQCKISSDDARVIGCDGEAKLIEPAKIKSYDFFTSSTKEKSPTFTYDIFKVRVGLDSESMHYLITMPFDPSQCFVENPDNFNKI